MFIQNIINKYHDKKEGIAYWEQYALANNLNAKELIQGIKLIEEHRKIIAKSAKTLEEWQGDNDAPRLLGALTLTLLQISTYEDPEYIYSAFDALKDILAKATNDNASPSELFEIMAVTSKYKGNGKLGE